MVDIDPRFRSPIRHQLSKLRQLQKRARVSASVYTTFSLKRCESNVCNMIACAKSDYENSLFRDYAFKQNHKMFSYIQSLRKKFGFPDGMHLDGKESSSWHGTACLFNEYFNNSVYTTPSNCNMFSPDSSIGPSVTFPSLQKRNRFNIKLSCSHLEHTGFECFGDIKL